MKALIKCHEADVRKDFKSEDRVMKIQDVKKLNKNSGILELRLVASPGQYRFSVLLWGRTVFIFSII